MKNFLILAALASVSFSQAAFAQTAAKPAAKSTTLDGELMPAYMDPELRVKDGALIKRVDRNPKVEVSGNSARATIASAQDDELGMNQFFVNDGERSQRTTLFETDSCKVIFYRHSVFPTVTIIADCKAAINPTYGRALIAKGIEVLIEKHGELVVFPIKTYKIEDASEVLKSLAPASDTTCGDASLIKVKQ